ncbi:39S ribosomal protein L48, mitochondrial [Apis laboriosa]|uniref:39S ribosomal protein L48, mitochondrial n=1 Tax=Apis laboriosa TaxID=183418 RepID=UPI001CC33E40|nr:39S ribosomal protein L48, mitochondrial [Apis laboriosa]
MILSVLKQFTTYYRCPLFNKGIRFYGIYEPPYLKKKEYEIPIYPVLNIQIKGYKYSLLESYQSFIHKIAKVLDITIDDSFAFPHKEFKIKKFKKNSTVIDAEYHLKIYERDIQISNISSTLCPILIRILEATLPEGVSLSIHEYDPILKKKCIIPNKELLDLKTELQEMTEHKTKKD